jgi:hypothetical protein
MILILSTDKTEQNKEKKKDYVQIVILNQAGNLSNMITLALSFLFPFF